MTKKVGYARVSTGGQSVDNQVAALMAAGIPIEDIYVEVESTRREQPVRDRLAASLRAGDELVVWRLDRYGRGVVGMVTAIEALRARGVVLRSLTEGLTTDDSTAVGRLVLQILLAVGEMERDLIRERTLLGLARARSQGRRGGRPRMDSSNPREAGRLARVAELRQQGLGVGEIARLVERSERTVHRWLAAVEAGR